MSSRSSGIYGNPLFVTVGPDQPASGERPGNPGLGRKTFHISCILYEQQYHFLPHSRSRFYLTLSERNASGAAAQDFGERSRVACVVRELIPRENKSLKPYFKLTNRYAVSDRQFRGIA